MGHPVKVYAIGNETIHLPNGHGDETMHTLTGHDWR
jgi:hypothetical protein